MKIRLYSDVHLEFAPFDPPEIGADVDVIVLAGDIHTKGRAPEWARSKFGSRPDRPPPPVIYICGNHEYFGSSINHILARVRSKSREHGIFFLENEEMIIRDQAKSRDVRFLGCTLWCGFNLHGAQSRNVSMEVAARRLNDYSRIKSWRGSHLTEDPWLGGGGRLTPSQVLRLHHASVEWLSNRLAVPFDGDTVVVTHHAPHRLSLPEDLRDDELAPAYASDLTRLIEERGPRLWLHGHIHSRSCYQIGPTKIISNPRGYTDAHGKAVERTGFDPCFIVEL